MFLNSSIGISEGVRATLFLRDCRKRNIIHSGGVDIKWNGPRCVQPQPNFSNRNEKPSNVNFKCLDSLTFTLDASNHILKNLKTDAGGIRMSVIESETDSV